MKSAFSSRTGYKPPSRKLKKKSDLSLLPEVLVKRNIVRVESQNEILMDFVKTQGAKAKTSLDRLLTMNSPINLHMDPAEDIRTIDFMPRIKNLGNFEAHSGF